MNASLGRSLLGGTALSVVRPSSGELPAETGPVSEFERDIALLLRAENRDPFRLLGPHIVEDGDEKRLVVRGFFPRAAQVSDYFERSPRPDSRPAHIVPKDYSRPSCRSSRTCRFQPDSYRWRVAEEGQPAREVHDTYAFPPLLSDFDLYLMGEGTHYQKYEKMGAHPMRRRWSCGSAVRRVGSQRDARERCGRFQSVGRPHAPDAESRAVGRMGTVCARTRRRRDLQVRNSAHVRRTYPC